MGILDESYLENVLDEKYVEIDELKALLKRCLPAIAYLADRNISDEAAKLLVDIKKAIK